MPGGWLTDGDRPAGGRPGGGPRTAPGRWGLAGWVLVVAATVTAACPSPAGSLPGAASPVYTRTASLSGPVTVGHVIEPVSGHSQAMPPGYVEQEFFASGMASAFRATSEPDDGRWTVEPTTSAQYRTRILVRRPTDPSHFNGTVVVEWMNVTVAETDPEWDVFNPYLTDAGFAYVAVSAQALGVEGGQGVLSSTPVKGLVQDEPSRYGSLHHPGDQYALDMFAQIGRALRLDRDPAVFGGLRPKHVIAAGESQSAFYLTTFANTLQPLTHAFDGLFIHSRGSYGAPLDGTVSTTFTGPGVRIRTDLDVPVFLFETQTDLIQLDYGSAQQPNTDRIRTWEVAGTSHADAFTAGAGLGFLRCSTPVNTGPQHEVAQAALAAMQRWVTHGTPPPSPPPFELASTHPPRLALDPNGNVVGGVRTPAVDVPVSTLSGAPPPGTDAICGLFGSTIAFSPARLVALYHDKANYMALYARSLDRAIAGGYILPADRADLLAQARQAQFPS